MKFQFESKLPHQLEAIKAVAGIDGLLQGAPLVMPEERLMSGEVSSNVLKLPQSDVLANAKRLADEAGIAEPATTDSMDFSIEMETGTGKTYVYLRTIFELNRRFGLHKFMIVVPSVAIREGTLKQLEQTKAHFSGIYGEQPEVIEYDSKKLPQVQNFCVSNHLSIMVLNKQSFDSDNKVINDEERDSGNLLEQLQNVQPIIIMDEPQEGMDTDNMQKRLAAFNPLFKLRYSATHREPKNIIHRLTPYDAYNQGLVKKISLLSIHEADTQSNVSIECTQVVLSSAAPKAKLRLNVRLKAGEFKTKVINVKHGDDLEAKTGNPVYHGWIIEDIGSTDIFDGEGYVKFTNGEQVEEGSTHGVDKATIFREQIRRSIQAHFHHKKRVQPLGIKPLALFFIDRVANYVDEEGLIRTIFEEEYEALYKKTYKTDAPTIQDVHGGYFATTKAGDYTDKESSMAKNKEIYEKILRDKETLLSFDEPLEFLFSHSALGVGWDNPNVFTICTLNETVSTTKKRQEIGRGLRLCVDETGQRYRDPADTKEGQEINLLTVVANESYHAFVSTYQDELEEEYGKPDSPHKPRNANKQHTTVRRNDTTFNSEDFKKLWAQIAKKTQCRVHFREEDLIEQCTKALEGIAVGENRLIVARNQLDSFDEEGQLKTSYQGEMSTAVSGQLTKINTVAELARNTAISEATAAQILANLNDAAKRQLAKNPMQFLADACKRIRIILSQEMVRLVKYEQTGESHPLDMLESEIPTFQDVIPTPNRGLYDHVICDSNIELNFAEDLDQQNVVRVFVKLPSAYKIPMPFGGTYNPDFALMIQKKNLDDPEKDGDFYFTVETKGTAEYEKLKEEEKLKILCAVKHFEAIGLQGYLAPVESLKSFDSKAREKVGETFFNQ